jgi:hypothetical protein
MDISPGRGETGRCNDASGGRGVSIRGVLHAICVVLSLPTHILLAGVRSRPHHPGIGLDTPIGGRARVQRQARRLVRVTNLIDRPAGRHGKSPLFDVRCPTLTNDRSIILDTGRRTRDPSHA